MKNIYRILSLILFILGLFILINPNSNIVGAFVGVSEISSMLNNLIGSSLIVISLVLFMVSEGGLEKKVSGKEYYHRRALELIEHPKIEDVWISRWEIDGLTREFENMNMKTIRGPHIGPGGRGSNIWYIKVEGYNQNQQYIRKHLLITNDPYDERLTRKINGFHSKVYRPDHPRDY